MPLAPGTTIGRYRIESRIGAGAMGVVYLALDERLERRVALKLIEPSLAADPDFRARFEREARAAAAIDHPHLLPVYEAGEDDGRLFLAMRYVPGVDLATHLARRGPIDVFATARLISQLATALDAAHASGLIHRDVKPANVLLGPDDHVYLADFGLARSAGPGITRPGQLVGTADYTAPELLRGVAASPASDTYALACVTAECLTGRPPFARDGELATLYAHANDPVPDFGAPRADFPLELQAVVARGLAKTPAERYPTAGAFAAALQDAAGLGAATARGRPSKDSESPLRELDPLIGREEELSTIMALLDRSRCVSLTGPGGSGKTRLAHAVIATLRGRAHRCWFVDASQLRDSSLLAPAMAAALRVDTSPFGDPIEAMADSLGAADAYVIVDNLEQMPDAGAVVEDILERVPNLRVLTTSRTKLAARGEVEFLVPTLALPASETPEAVEGSPAGALFLARARSVGFTTLDATTASAVGTLLRRLDGLPLALELAAARTRIIGPAEILFWLDERGLAAVDGASPDPHRSLRDILTWTIGLLSSEETAVLKAASICSSFDVQLVQQLVPKVDVLGPIEALVGLGLVRRGAEVDSSSRFVLLETIRAHVRKQSSSAEQTRLRGLHAAAMRSEATLLSMRKRGAEPQKALARLDAEADNFRLALDWLDQRVPGHSLELWTSLEGLWTSHHRNREGMARFERTASLAPQRSLQLSRATSRYVGLAFDVQGSVRSKELNLRALGLAREVGDLESEVEALGGVVMAAVTEGDQELVRKAAAEVAALSASLVDPEIRWTAAQTRCFAAMSLFGAQSDEMRDAYREAVDVAIQSGRVDFEMNSRGNLAVVQLYRREFEEATENGERAVELARQIDSHLLDWCLGTLAIALAETGRVGRAIEVVLEAAADVAILSVPERIGDVLTAAAAVALAAGRPVLAARLVGTVLSMHVADPSIAQPENVELLTGIVDRVRDFATAADVDGALKQGKESDPLAAIASVPDELSGVSAR